MKDKSIVKICNASEIDIVINLFNIQKMKNTKAQAILININTKRREVRRKLEHKLIYKLGAGVDGFQFNRTCTKKIGH